MPSGDDHKKSIAALRSKNDTNLAAMSSGIKGCRENGFRAAADAMEDFFRETVQEIAQQK